MSNSLIGNRKLLRGDIFTFDFGKNDGSVQSGVRPAVIIQNSFLNKSSGTTIIAPTTSVIKKVTMRSHVLISKNYGLKEDSMILLEQMRVVNQSELFEYIGTISDKEVLNKIDYGIKALFGIKTHRYVNNEMKTLCPKCLEKELRRDNSIVKRVDSFEKKTYICDFCRESGNRYFIIPKKSQQKE